MNRVLLICVNTPCWKCLKVLLKTGDLDMPFSFSEDLVAQNAFLSTCDRGLQWFQSIQLFSEALQGPQSVLSPSVSVEFVSEVGVFCFGIHQFEDCEVLYAVVHHPHQTTGLCWGQPWEFKWIWCQAELFWIAMHEALSCHSMTCLCSFARGCCECSWWLVNRKGFFGGWNWQRTMNLLRCMRSRRIWELHTVQWIVGVSAKGSCDFNFAFARTESIQSRYVVTLVTWAHVQLISSNHKS